MAKETQFNSKRQPNKRRGRDKRTLILESMAKASRIGLTPESTKEEAEEAFFEYLSGAAFNQEDSARSVCLSALLDRGWSKLKPESSHTPFELKAETLFGKAEEILTAVSDGNLTVEQGSALIGAISNVMKIKEVEEFDERLKALEAGKDEQV